MMKKSFISILAILMMFVNMGGIAEARAIEPSLKGLETGINESVSSITEYTIGEDEETILPLPKTPRNLGTSTEGFIPNDLNLEMSPRVIVGRDDRTRVTNTTSFPNSAIGQVVVTWPNGATSRATAWMYGNKVAVTAGHVVYNSSRGGWARSVAFYPGRNGTTTALGVYYATQLYTDTKYVASQDSNFDWGMIRFGTNVGATTGFFGAEWTSASQVNTQVIVRGYPGEKSNQMWTSSGPITASFATRTRYTIDTTSGQSGSPVYRGSTTRAVAIHSSGTSSNGVGVHNTGQRITEGLFNIINDARRW